MLSDKDDGQSRSGDGGGAATVTIKKYANRRLYNTSTSSYVTLDTLAKMVKSGEEFVVFDAKSGEDITRSVLTQIIFEEEAKGENLLPIKFLRQLIGFYGNSMQGFVPSYLEMSIDALTNNQAQFTRAFGGEAAVDAMQAMTRRNVEMFENTMRMFSPFAAQASAAAAAAAPEKNDASKGRDTEIDTLREQVANMQKAIDAMSKKG